MRIFFLRRAWHVLAACSLASALAAPALGQVDPLSLEEALRLAAERSQQLVTQDAAATAARERAVAAETRPDFVLTTGIENLPIEGPHDFSLTQDFMTMTSIGIERELVGDAKRSAAAARYTREAEAAEAARSPWSIVQAEREKPGKRPDFSASSSAISRPTESPPPETAKSRRAGLSKLFRNRATAPSTGPGSARVTASLRERLSRTAGSARC